MPPNQRIRTVDGSCWSCRERRVICDLGQPGCNKCSKLQLECSYGKLRLRWTNCVATRGRLAGRTIPWLQPPLMLEPPLMQSSSSDTRLMYFENVLLPRFNLSNTVPKIDLKRISQDALLLRSVTAVANAHQILSNRSIDQESNLSLVNNRKTIFPLFVERLEAANTNSANKALFITSVLFCILDGIIEPGANASATHAHLLGGNSILKHWGGVDKVLAQEGDLPAMMLSIYATMDLTHALLMGSAPYFEKSNWPKFGGRTVWWGNLSPDDYFLKTIDILSQLATLGHKVRAVQVKIPIDKLEVIQQELKKQSNQQLNHAKDEQEKLSWAAFCTVYRFAASVYMGRALCGLRVDDYRVQYQVTECIKVIGGVNLTHQHHHCILFPLLVIATHCLIAEQRDVIRQSIVKTATYLSFEGLRSFNAFLERRWETLDKKSDGIIESSWWAYFEEIAAATCLF